MPRPRLIPAGPSWPRRLPLPSGSRRTWRTRRLGILAVFAAASAGLVTPAWRAGAQSLPPLPLPPPPPSAAASLAEQTVAQLFPPDASPLPAARAESTFAVAWTYVPAQPGAGRPPRLQPADRERAAAFLADAVEAAIRARGPIAGRVSEDQEADLRVELELRVAADRLTVAARLRRPPRTVWEALRTPRGALLRTGFAAAALDLELRALLGLGPRAVRLGRLRLRWLADSTHPLLGEAPVLALTVADLDGDRAPEVVALQPSRVLVLRWERGGPRALLASEPLGPGGFNTPPNEAPLRQPMGRLVVITRPDGSRAVAAAASDWARAVVFTFAGGALTAAPARPSLPALSGAPPPAPLRGWPLYALGPDRVLTAPWPHGVDVLSGALVQEDISATTVGSNAAGSMAAGSITTGQLAPGAWSVQSFPFWADASPPWDPFAVAARPGGRLDLRSLRGPRLGPKAAAGDVVALGDLDADGSPELLTTSDRVDGTDLLRLYALSQLGRPRLLWRASLDAPVTALALGDPTGAGRPQVLLAVAGPAGRARLAAVVPGSRAARRGRR